ncbi:adenosine 5'-monophosphoramidase HINT3 isoform X2 [Aethina tumida]|nr:adenosine 5'-monophosphoramidase HINT3 isoform X2 [Aethina tumida]
MNQNCIFCKIITGEANSTKYYEDEETLVFKDIKPAAKHHFLSIPKKHITNINSLTKDDIPLVNKLVEEGKKVLLEQKGETENMLLGFHCPPFNAISHLHLHVISPRNEMSFLSQIMFRPKSWWFITVDDVLHNLQNKL